VLNFICFFKF